MHVSRVVSDERYPIPDTAKDKKSKKTKGPENPTPMPRLALTDEESPVKNLLDAIVSTIKFYWCGYLARKFDSLFNFLRII